MRLFNELIFDDDISGTGITWYSLTEYNPLLGSADALVIQAHTGSASGTSPTLTIRCQFSGDSLHWANAQANPEINTTTLSANGKYLITKDGTTGGVLMGYVRYAISLGGTNPATRLKIVACGRSL